MPHLASRSLNSSLTERNTFDAIGYLSLRLTRNMKLVFNWKMKGKGPPPSSAYPTHDHHQSPWPFLCTSLLGSPHHFRSVDLYFLVSILRFNPNMKFSKTGSVTTWNSWIDAVRLFEKEHTMTWKVVNESLTLQLLSWNGRYWSEVMRKIRTRWRQICNNLLFIRKLQLVDTSALAVG